MNVILIFVAYIVFIAIFFHYHSEEKTQVREEIRRLKEKEWEQGYEKRKEEWEKETRDRGILPPNPGRFSIWG